MAGYIVTSGSNFTPFTYDELVKPIQQFTEAQYAASENFDKLALDTEALRNYINETNDPVAWKMYNNYAQKLQALQDNLWKNGYNAGTVRDLSAARNGYASDITRLASAIEARQTRSKEYWDAVHKDPTLVAGWDPADPIRGSLDNYLNDSNFGQDWYSYNGTTLANEVAADIDAKASELYSQATVAGDVPGYLTRILSEGFSSDELNAGTAAAKAYLDGDENALKNLQGPASIVADVLINRMNSTGARYGEDGNLSKDAYDRLFGYATMGLANGIRKPQVKDIEDKQWEFQKQAALASMRQAASSAGENITDNGYVVDSLISQLASENAGAAARDINRQYEGIFQKDVNGNNIPINLRMPDGRSIPVSSVEEMTDMIYNTPERQEIMNVLGFDIGLKGQNWLGTSDSRQKTVVSQNGKQAVFDTANLPARIAKELGITSKNPVAIRQYIDNKPVLNKEYTKWYNEKLASHQAYVDTIRKLNKNNFKIKDVTVTPKEAKKLKEKYGLDQSLPDELIRTAIETKESVSRRAPAVIADASETMSSVRKDISNNILASFTQAKTYAGKSFRETDKSNATYAFFPVKNGKIAEEGTTKLSDVFTTDKTGLHGDSLKDVSAFPSDILKGNVRITTDKGTFVVNANMLGSLYGNTIADPQFKSSIDLLMTPFNKPDLIMNADEETNRRLTSVMYQILGTAAPVGYDVSGRPVPVTVQEIAANPKWQSVLYSGIINYINTTLAHPRELKGQHHYQHTGVSSTKPQQFNSFLK